MSVSCEVKRTLVKSPPELWSELSDPDSLARHLDGLGEVKITRAAPETEVEWEAGNASGSVRLEPSGFGTRVTLSLSREVAEPVAVAATDAQAAAEPEAVVEPDPVAEAEAVAQPEATVATQGTVEPEPVAEAQPVAEPQPRRGFFARLFKRRRKEPAVEAGSQDHAPTELAPQIAAEPEPEAPAEPEPGPEAIADARPESDAEVTVGDGAEPTDLATDLATLEARMAEQDEALLTAMLDRLGAAHHRPFSRS